MVGPIIFLKSHRQAVNSALLMVRCTTDQPHALHLPDTHNKEPSVRTWFWKAEGDWQPDCLLPAGVFLVAVSLCCDLQGRKSNFTNSKTLVGRDRPSRAFPVTCPNVNNSRRKIKIKIKNEKSFSIFSNVQIKIYPSLQVRSDNEEALKHVLKDACEQVHLECTFGKLLHPMVKRW